MFAMFVGSPLFILLVVGATPAVWFLIAMMGRQNVKKSQNLMQTGLRGAGQILSVADTGMTINDNPRVALTLQVQPDNGGPAFQLAQTATVSRIAIPRQGDQVVVWYDPNDPNKFTWQPAPAVTTN
jgi:hypothetical protein